MCVSMQAEAIAQQEFMSKYPGKKPSTFAQRKISNKGVSCLCIIDEHVLVESNFCRASFYHLSGFISRNPILCVISLS